MLRSVHKEKVIAKGREKHQAYLDALNLLGKDLARRAKSKCELSEESGTLEIFDLEGPDAEPDLNHVLLVSPKVAEYLGGKSLKGANLRYLETTVWSTQPAIRRAAVRILERIDEAWAHDAIQNAHSMEG